VDPTSASSPVAANKWVLAYATWADAHAKAGAALLVLICLPALVLTALFFSDVRAGLTELLPPDAPASKALETLHERLGGVSRLAVIAESNDPKTNRRFITELGERLEARHLPEIRTLQANCRAEVEWAKNRAPLLMDKAKFDEAMDAAEKEIRQAKQKANPLFVSIEEEEPAPSQSELETKLDAELARNDRYPYGLYQDKSGEHVLLMISLNGSETEVGPSESLLKSVRAEVDALRPRYPPALVIGYHGEVPNLVEEHDAILADLSLSSVLVFVLVGAVIFIYFRSLRGLLTVLFALTPGLLFTFAVGKLTVGHLNSNTAFLGSIIAGNGINYPLLFLAYYRGRGREEPRPLAIALGARQAFFGTLGAALAASAAYGALSVSTFRGFSQFGWLGGVGMVTTWLFTFIAMPLAISLFDPPRVTQQSPTQQWLERFFSSTHAPRAVALSCVALALAGGAFGVRNAMEGGLFEMNLSALRNRYSLTRGAASWDGRVAQVFGFWLNPVGGLVDDPVNRESLKRAIAETLVDGPEHLAERVQTIANVVPPLEEQAPRLMRLRKLKRTIEKLPKDQLPEKARPYLERWSREENLKPMTLDEVPASVRAPFTEVDGRTDRVVLLFPRLSINYDDARNVMLFDQRLREVKTPPGAVVGGGFLFMAEIIELVEREAPRIVIVVAFLVALVLLPLFRRRPWRLLVVVPTVAAVAVLSQANMIALGVRINMLSFAATPITIGVGADYVVNLFGAMDAFNADARRACAKMGGAIFLCSATTIIGYASLVVADSGALRTFGWAAVLGELMAVTAVLLVLPVALARASPSGPAAKGSSTAPSP
jgi:predicted RND superfamily exporter protein